MRVVLEHQGREREVELVVDDPDASVGALVGAALPELGAAWPELDDAVVALDGRWTHADARLDELGLYEGAWLLVTSAPAGTPPARLAAVSSHRGPAEGPLLAVAGGLRAGALHAVGRGVVVGRDPGCDVVLEDPTVSARHARVWQDKDGRLYLADLGSRNGTWLDGVPAGAVDDARAELGDGSLLRLGATELRVRAGTPPDRPAAVGRAGRGPGGPVTFNRPPRPAAPPGPAEISVPEPPAPQQGARALSIAAIAAPLLLGAVLIALYREPRFALFMLLSPLVAVGTWLSSRRQARRQRRRDVRAFRRALADFGAALATAARQERRRRESLTPDLAEVVRRAAAPSTRLWERRGGDHDALRVRLGTGDVPWQPPLAPVRSLDDAVGERVAAHAVLRRCPVEADLAAGVVGLVGDREAALAVARALVVQLATHHGPADVALAVVAGPARASDWGWTAWLPHLRDERGHPRLAAGPQPAEDVLGRCQPRAPAERAQPASGPPQGSPQQGAPLARTTVVVLDDVTLLSGRRSPVRRLLQGAAGPVAGIVLAASDDQLPAVTTAVVDLQGPLGAAVLTRPQEGQRLDDVVANGITEGEARDLARTLARYEDPELGTVGSGLPLTVRLPPLLGLEDIDAGAVEALWADRAADPRPTTPLGVGEHGPVWIDLLADGPHGLVGGTTGAGKSELLRSLVVGLAAGSDPDRLVFVLIDYKGGSAFDACSALPHCVGLVTDLDAHLGERALRSLDAELRHREQVLRRTAASDLPAYVAAGAPAGPLPRLVVVIDEFATLAVELPDFLGALVAAAQRGRSLGVHLVLATQRPAAVVSSAIRANTNLRVALRVQDAHDSTDVVERPDAAGIPRDAPGRAYVRLGHGDVVAVQTPLVTGRPDVRGGGVRVRRLRDGLVEPTPVASEQVPEGEPTDLDRLVAAICEAERRRGGATPRRPWLAMLPETVAFADLGPASDPRTAAFALADDPDRQRRVSVGWRPDDGHLAIFGTVGSGKTTALRALARAIVQTHDPARFHLYGIDAASGELADLMGLPHVGAVAGAGDSERRLRILRRLRTEIDNRRASGRQATAAGPAIVLLVDGVSALLADIDEPEAVDAGEAFRRVLSDGPAVGVTVALTGDRPAALPLRLASSLSQRILLRLADSGDYATAGLRPGDVPDFVPGRGVRGQDGLVIQIADPGDAAELAGAWPDASGAWSDAGGAWSDPSGAEPDPSGGGPPPVGTLPAELRARDLPTARAHAGSRASGGVRVVVGVDEADLGAAELVLGPGDHTLVAGPPGSGKSWALTLFTEQLRTWDEDLVLVGVCGERSPLHGSEALDAAGLPAPLDRVLAAAPGDTRRWVVLVDDAPAVEDAGGRLAALLQAGRSGLHLVAAGRTDDLRRGYAHWSRPVRQSRTGVLLQPDLTGDGELLGVRLPRRVAVPLLPGRGFVVGGGGSVLAQLAMPAALAPPAVDIDYFS